MSMRGIRGAITVEQNEKDAIWQAAKAMMQELIARNELAPEDIGAVIFSMTEDLTAAFPTALPGFDLVPLFDARQCAIEGSLGKCIRVLVLADTEKKQRDIRHIYMGRAVALRPDIC